MARGRLSLNANVVLPLLTSLISLTFAAVVCAQYLRRRKPYQLVWTLGLVWYAGSAGAEFLGNTLGWNVALYRWWYVTGAFYVAAYLGMGTVYLLAPRRLAHAIMAVLAIGSVYAALRVLTADVEVALLPRAGQVVSGQALAAGVRVLTPFFNIFGAGALVFGAAYSAWVFWRRRLMPHRVASNVLIAVGAFIPTVTSGLSRFGFTDAFFLGEFLGVVFIFGGFLVSVEVFERRAAVARTPQGAQSARP